MELPKTGLDWVSSFDLITPLAAYIQDAMNGPAAHFGVTPEINRRDLRRLLKRNGVDVWGLMLSPAASTVNFSVKKSQAQQVRQILEKAKIQIIYCPHAAADQQERQQGWIKGMFE